MIRIAILLVVCVFINACNSSSREHDSEQETKLEVEIKTDHGKSIHETGVFLEGKIRSIVDQYIDLVDSVGNRFRIIKVSNLCSGDSCTITMHLGMYWHPERTYANEVIRGYLICIENIDSANCCERYYNVSHVLADSVMLKKFPIFTENVYFPPFDPIRWVLTKSDKDTNWIVRRYSR